MLRHGQSPLALARVLAGALDSFEALGGPSLAYREVGRGRAYVQAIWRLVPVLEVRVSQVPKAFRRLSGAKLRAEPGQVSPARRYRAMLRAGGLAFEGRSQRGLRQRVLWVFRDLAKPGLGSALFSKKVGVYQEAIRYLRQGI